MQDGDFNYDLGSGFVPPEILKSIYEDPVRVVKPFDLVLMQENKAIGTLQLALKSKGLVQV